MLKPDLNLRNGLSELGNLTYSFDTSPIFVDPLDSWTIH